VEALTVYPPLENSSEFLENHPNAKPRELVDDVCDVVKAFAGGVKDGVEAALGMNDIEDPAEWGKVVGHATVNYFMTQLPVGLGNPKLFMDEMSKNTAKIIDAIYDQSHQAQVMEAGVDLDAALDLLSQFKNAPTGKWRLEKAVERCLLSKNRLKHLGPTGMPSYCAAMSAMATAMTALGAFERSEMQNAKETVTAAFKHTKANTKLMLHDAKYDYQHEVVDEATNADRIWLKPRAYIEQYDDGNMSGYVTVYRALYNYREKLYRLNEPKFTGKLVVEGEYGGWYTAEATAWLDRCRGILQAHIDQKLTEVRTLTDPLIAHVLPAWEASIPDLQKLEDLSK